MRRIPLRVLVLAAFFLTGIYYLVCCSSIQIRDGDNSSTRSVQVVINFLIPMDHGAIYSKIRVIPEIPFTTVDYQAKWLNARTLVVTLDQKGYPTGQQLEVRIKGAPSSLPFIKKSVNTQVRRRVIPELTSGTLLQNVPTGKPLNFYFNTPIDEASLKSHTRLPVPGKLQPVRFEFNGRSYTDYSRWQYYPDRPLNHDHSYMVVFKPGIKSLGGGISEKSREVKITTLSAPRILEVSPPENARNVKLYRLIEFTLDREAAAAEVTVTDPGEHINIPGQTGIEGNKIIFKPARAFLPGKSYKVSIKVRTRDGEILPERGYFFSTVDTGDKLWVDVKLGDIHTVKVYRGSILVRHMIASGGKSKTPTPRGYFVTQDRGHSFWSPRFGEGAMYWVRLVGQVLVHSVPKDSRWQTKEEEHAKLGLPASHGCIRLDEKDAKWFYENIPMGTTVIIHQ